MAGRVVVGTSSWADPGFVEEWYPPGMAARDRLAWYAERFEAVEVNASFYAVPARRTVKRWCEVTPDGFTFDVKLHRVLSRHAAKVGALPPELRDGAKTNEPRARAARRATRGGAGRRFLAELEPLCAAGKLATFLVQLSPAFKPGAHELDELAGLIERLAPHPVAIELRHIGWVDGDRLASTLRWLSEHDAAFVCTDGPQGDAPTMMPPVDAATRDDVAYVRAHGRRRRGLQARADRRRALRLGLRRRGARGDRGAHGGARAGGPDRAGDVQQQPRRRRAARGRADARAGVVSAGREAALAAIADEIRAHGGCGLAACETAANAVPGEGPADARVAIVGEAPGASEDKQGRPFVGSAGRLLAELLGLAGLTREEVFVTNVLKSRPPKNRNPRKAEVEHSLPWLYAQLAVVQPELIVPLGRFALTVFAPGAKISELHGTLVARPDAPPLFPLYHPASALHRHELREVLRADAVKLAEALGTA